MVMDPSRLIPHMVALCVLSLFVVIIIIVRWVLFTECPDDFDYLGMIRKKHERLFQQQGLNESHYDRFMGYLMETMHAMGIASDLIEEAEHTMRFIRDVFCEGSHHDGEYE